MAFLITGTSSGIGKAAAQRLMARGATVVATARNVDDIQDLQEAGATVMALDVTDEASMQAAVDATLATHGRIDGLVNNAGFGAYVPWEETSPEQLRHMFEVNVFGLHRLTQLVLPHMREQGSGRIVNVASVAGHLALPMFSAYCATKFSVRAMTLALDSEVRPFGIRASLIEPGRIKTRFGDRALQESPMDGGPYAVMKRRMEKMIHKDAGGTPEVTAKAITHACLSRRPRLHYLAPLDAKAGHVASRLLPDAWINAAARKALWR